jgi:phosphoribosylformimino-5-aminoimidazole carboxamide ribotide isomerase
VNDENAKEWLDAGAGKVSIRQPTMNNCSLMDEIMDQVIVTSYLFPGGKFSLERLQATASVVGKERLVVDVRYLSSFLIQLLAN